MCYTKHIFTLSRCLILRGLYIKWVWFMIWLNFVIKSINHIVKTIPVLIVLTLLGNAVDLVLSVRSKSTIIQKVGDLYPYPIRLTPIGGKTMRQFSERFSSCRTQQEYTQVGIRIFRFFRTEGSNRFPDRRRIPTCEARHGNPIDFPMLQWEFEEKPRPHYNRP